jgi:hypothetical protein
VSKYCRVPVPDLQTTDPRNATLEMSLCLTSRTGFEQQAILQLHTSLKARVSAPSFICRKVQYVGQITYSLPLPRHMRQRHNQMTGPRQLDRWRRRKRCPPRHSWCCRGWPRQCMTVRTRGFQGCSGHSPWRRGRGQR